VNSCEEAQDTTAEGRRRKSSALPSVQLQAGLAGERGDDDRVGGIDKCRLKQNPGYEFNYYGGLG